MVIFVGKRVEDEGKQIAANEWGEEIGNQEAVDGSDSDESRVEDAGEGRWKMKRTAEV